MGVITTVRLPEGTTFGPVPPSVTLADPIVLIGHRTSDTPPDIHTVKLDLASFSSGLMHLVEWVPYVQAARDTIEQNMEATIDDVDHQLYFRVTRTVSANGELLIWYSDKLAARIGVPEIKDDFIRDGVYCCPSCHELFTYPNCLRAHLRFRCKYRQQQQKLQQIHQLVPGIAPGHVITTSYGQSPITALANFREAAIALEAASFSRHSASYENGRLRGDGSPSGSVEERSRNYNRSVPDVGDSRHRTPSGDRKSIGSCDGTFSPREAGDKRSSNAAVKRRRLEESSPEGKRITSAGSTGTQSKISRSSLSPLTYKTDGESSADECDVLTKNSGTFEASSSAFHQVSRASPALTMSSSGAVVPRCGSIGSASPAESLSVTPPARPFSSELIPTSMLNTASTLDLAVPDKASVVAAATAAMMSGMFLFPQLAAARAAAAAAAVAALPLGMQHQHSDRFRAVTQLPVGLPPTSMHSTSSSSWANGLGINNNNINNNNNNIMSNLTKNNVNKLASVQGIFSQNYDINAQHRLGSAQHPSLPFVYRSQNPMAVDKMLHMFGSSPPPQSPTPTSVASHHHHHLAHSQQQPPPLPTPHLQTVSAVSGPLQSTMMSLNLSQNWCAKCNTSFRMTSDLVYHMRSHHKRDFDPVKRRKDDKLRCDVCGETFRERHHLTRHMTSHS